MEYETLLLLEIAGGLTLYALLGGADFGAGIWEFNSALLSSKKEKRLIHKAIGPVWEANHVWLIFVIVGLFTAFPLAFSTLCKVLWVPLLLALCGIVFRGAAFAFFSYAKGATKQQNFWEAVFALASMAAPFFLGAAVGAIASGKLDIDEQGHFHGNQFSGWIQPFSIFSGFFGVGLCAFLAAVYLTREAKLANDEELTLMWRRRAIAAALWMGVLAIVGLFLVASEAPSLWKGFQEKAWPLVGGSALAGISSILFLWKRRFLAAAFSAGAAVATILWGWIAAQYPLLIAPSISIDHAKAAKPVLQVMTWGFTAGALLLFPALAYLFYFFKRR